MSEIQTRKFSDETGEFLLELSLGNIMTIFETDLQVSNNGQLKSGKFESVSFNFGSFEWNVSIVIHNYGATTTNFLSDKQNDSNRNGLDDNRNRIIYVFLNRLSGFDHPCRVQYRVTVGEERNCEDSGVLDQISDAGGRIRGFQMKHSLSDLLKPNGSVRIYVELNCCNAISEAKVPIVRNPSPTINCYDRNKQGWCIEADLDSKFLRLKLFFMDLHSVPRNHLRYISWIAYVIAKDPRNGLRESLAVVNSPHSNYYVQDGIDMGVMMDTTLPVAKIKESPKIYLENEKLTVHVEWCDSIMLFNHIYHKYDDITRVHGHQMRREIMALGSENYSLEKQLISYQKTIGNSFRSLSSSSSSTTASTTTTTTIVSNSTITAVNMRENDQNEIGSFRSGHHQHSSSLSRSFHSPKHQNQLQQNHQHHQYHHHDVQQHQQQPQQQQNYNQNLSGSLSNIHHHQNQHQHQHQHQQNLHRRSNQQHQQHLHHHQYDHQESNVTESNNENFLHQNRMIESYAKMQKNFDSISFQNNNDGIVYTNNENNNCDTDGLIGSDSITKPMITIEYDRQQQQRKLLHNQINLNNNNNVNTINNNHHMNDPSSSRIIVTSILKQTKNYPNSVNSSSTVHNQQNLLGAMKTFPHKLHPSQSNYRQSIVDHQHQKLNKFDNFSSNYFNHHQNHRNNPHHIANTQIGNDYYSRDLNYHQPHSLSHQNDDRSGRGQNLAVEEHSRASDLPQRSSRLSSSLPNRTSLMRTRPLMGDTFYCRSSPSHLQPQHRQHLLSSNLINSNQNLYIPQAQPQQSYTSSSSSPNHHPFGGGRFHTVDPSSSIPLSSLSTPLSTTLNRWDHYR
ncbi:hypothetical protein SSS_01888 [Sarcoptes scabiei]|uniref:MATH domain-containing protein n=1 Tax=Sarcoptes scabiei TaxID=52283 RepID=A0A834R8V6_SARSC|nr:hypothetical protein SSS_01888 [Sarcoptes scabiei]